MNQYSTAQSERSGKPQWPQGGKRHLPPRPQGFSLVEVLVAALVLTIGLLGLAALQVTGLKATESAHLRTLATLAVYDAIERLRADPVALRAADGTCTISSTACGETTSLIPTRQRWYDTFCSLGLPKPTANAHASAISVICPGTTCGAGNCEITVNFDDARAGSGDTSFQVCTRLPSPVCLAAVSP